VWMDEYGMGWGCGHSFLMVSVWVLHGWFSMLSAFSSSLFSRHS
jgi:hypothetical protein